MVGAQGQARAGGGRGVPGAEPPTTITITTASTTRGASRPAGVARRGAGAAACRRVPAAAAAAAAQVHLHEAFPLQFTLPSDKPNFSFSE